MTDEIPANATTNPFSTLLDVGDIASLLDTSRARLRYLIYRMSPVDRYRTFVIRKRNGTDRIISAPIPELMELQRRLHVLLLDIYQPKRSTHGFVLDRSILTNARTHLAMSILLNIDLEEFFPSIHLGRVRGRFMAKPFLCPPSGATILAQLCCHEGKLPQGAPTSPTISNLICARMDVELQRFAADRQCRYTRYADDITFSTKMRAMSSDLVGSESRTELRPILGSPLTEIIERHGFQINLSKVRLQHRSQRQVVTGLKVNRFPNPSKKLLSQIRAMLHALEEFGLEAAEQEYRTRYARKHRAPNRGPASFASALRGKIQFIAMIRGQSSPAFIRLARELRRIAPQLVPHWDVRTLNERISDALWVLESEETSTQGTGFFLHNVGLVTCEHVVHPNMTAFKANEPLAKFPVRVIASNAALDLAVCEIDAVGRRSLTPQVARATKYGDEVIVAGFPNFRLHDSARISPGVVVSFRTVSTIKRMVLNTPIVSGNSGGPVLNPDGAVIGIAVTGTDRPGLPDYTADYGVIPVDALRHLIPTFDVPALD